MASYDQYHNRLNQVRDSSSVNSRHGFSKAQACLNKILHTISSAKPCETSKEQLLKPQIDDLSVESTALCRPTRGFDIDLNLRFCPSPETDDESESLAIGGSPSACSAVGETVESNSPAVSVEKCLKGEFEANFVSVEANHVDVIGTEVSEVTNSQVRSFETGDNGVFGEESKKIKAEEGNQNEVETHKSKECRSEGFLGLLIEAAVLVSGEFEEDEEPEAEKPSQEEQLGRELSVKTTTSETETETETTEWTKRIRSKSKRKHCEMLVDLYGDFEDISPVVRSKRGRSQVLPYRYRDSVIEPWRRSSKQRSTTVTTKRRSTRAM